MVAHHAALPRPAAVILDLDGTLVDTVGTRIAAWLAAFAAEGIEADESQVAQLIGSDGRRLAREVARAAGVALAPGRDEEIDARSGQIYGELNTAPRPLPGVESFLKRLDGAAIPWAIATSSRREQVAASVDALHRSRQPLVIDGSHVADAKPAPDLLLLAASTLGVDPRSAWYVGDSAWDMLAATAAGMTAIGVTTGAVGADGLVAAGAGRVVGSLAELEI
jgi:HAD superfamily hydrolase (TIGR01509 family)